MGACSAAAHFLPPMLRFPGTRFSYNPLEGFEEAALGRSETGWIDSEVFNQWLENVFIPGVGARNVKKPVLLLIDGHSSHVNLKSSDTCVQHGIELYCLLEHASHVIQPLDLRLFGSLKKHWRQAVRDWQAENIGEYVTKVTFARVFKKAWEASTTAEVAIKGFEEAGLFALNPSVTSSFKIEPSKIFRQQETETPENQEPNGPEESKTKAAETSQQKTQNPDNRELNRPEKTETQAADTTHP